MFSLTGAVQSCSVNTGYANKLQSDRFENPQNLLCPLWNGLDQYGRVSSYDSYMTKAPGCQSAEDRVAVENYQRPHYIDFIPLDASGYLNPSALGSPVSSKENFQKTTALLRGQAVKELYHQGGSVGTSYMKTNAPYSTGKDGVDGCPNGDCKSGFQVYRQPKIEEGYADTRASRNFQERRDLSAIAAWKSNCNACSAGNR